MADILFHPATLTLAIGVVIIAVYELLWKDDKLPDIPILGARAGEWFPLLRAGIRNMKDVKTVLNASYAENKDRAVIFPLADALNFILLPPSDTQFVSEQPEDVLSMHEFAQYTLQTDYTTMDPWLTHDPIHLELVKGTLTKEVGNLVPDLADEIKHCFDESWGRHADTNEICVYETMQYMLSGVTNRAFTGLPLCRNEEVRKLGIAFAQDVPLSSFLLKLVPSFVRPLVAPLITLPNRLHTRRFVRLLADEIRGRLKDFDSPSDAAKAQPNSNNDFLQWSIAQAKEIGDPKNWQVNALAQRVLLLNFAAIHTSSFAITHAILDLAASPPEVVAEIRREVETTLQSHGGQWNKRALAQMVKLDSAIRESQRKNSFVTVGVNRTVKPKEGITFPSGVHVRQGLTVCVYAYSVHQDGSVYPDPKEYKPFRFYDSRVEHSAEYVQSARQAFPTTSKEFLGWGLGRSACPGRFFASNEIKMMLAYMLLNYEVEPLAARPRNTWIGQNRLPPMKATIRVRRVGST